MVFCFIIVSNYFSTKKVFENDKLLQKEQEYTFNQNGISFFNENSNAIINWEEIYKYEDSKSNILIYISPVKSLIIPKRFLNDKELDHLKNILKNNIITKKKSLFSLKPRFSFYLIYIVIVGGVLLNTFYFNDQTNENYEKGYAKEQKEDYEGAIIEYSKAINENPSFAKAYNHRGYAKGMLGDYTGELEDCSKAIDLDKNYGYAYYNRGDAKYSLNDSIGACNDYHKALDVGFKDAKKTIEDYCK